MNQAKIDKLIPALRFAVPKVKKKMSNPDGPEGRLKILRRLVTALVKHERIEASYGVVDETRQYSERLISEAVRHGDRHRPTMEMADFWLDEKQLVHKLFKVLVPRYESSHTTYTRILRAPTFFPLGKASPNRAVLELRGNPYPPLAQPKPNAQLIHNVLLEEAAKEFRQEQRKKAQEKDNT